MSRRAESSWTVGARSAREAQLTAATNSGSSVNKSEQPKRLDENREKVRPKARVVGLVVAATRAQVHRSKLINQSIESALRIGALGVGESRARRVYRLAPTAKLDIS